MYTRQIRPYPVMRSSGSEARWIVPAILIASAANAVVMFIALFVEY